MENLDSYKHRGLRRQLVAELQQKGINDKKVLEAIGAVPRHLFMDSSFLSFAYQDKAFPIGSGQTISQPFTVAVQSALLNIEKGMKVLEIGTGSGYQATILAEMGARVFTIERQHKLYIKVKHFIDTLGYKIQVFYRDGFKGLPTFAPFDRIIITAGVPQLPEKLIEQLKPGGLLVAPVGKRSHQVMTRIQKMDDGSLRTEHFGDFVFVPMLPGQAND